MVISMSLLVQVLFIVCMLWSLKLVTHSIYCVGIVLQCIVLYFDNIILLLSKVQRCCSLLIQTLSLLAGHVGLHTGLFMFFFLKSELKMKVHMISLSTDNCSANLTYRSAVEVFSLEEFLSRLVCEM